MCSRGAAAFGLLDVVWGSQGPPENYSFLLVIGFGFRVHF